MELANRTIARIAANLGAPSSQLRDGTKVVRVFDRWFAV